MKIRPGEELGKAISSTLKTKAQIIPCPEGWDVSSMVAAGRAEELKIQMAGDEDDLPDDDDEDSDDASHE